MAKKRILISINEPQNIVLKRMMEEDLQTNISSFIGSIIFNEYKRRGYKFPIKKTKSEIDLETYNYWKKKEKEEEDRKKWATLSINSKK